MRVSRYKIFLVVVLVGWGIALYQFYDFSTSKLKKMKRARTKIEAEIRKEKRELQKLQDFAQNIEVIKEELRALNLQLETALEYMPPEFDLSGVLRQLTTLAQNAGVKIYSFNPEVVQAAASGESTQFYQAVRIRSELEGTFTQMLVFLDQLSRLKRVINVDELKMTAGEAIERTGSVRVRTAALLKTYRFSQ